MVIQRVWRSSVSVGTPPATSAPEVHHQNINPNSSESESSSSSQTHAHNASILQKLKNAMSGEATLDALKQRYSGRSFISQTANDAAIKSLELLRANIQCFFDKEVDQVVKKYHQTYFVPAIRNIKENLGDGAISDEALKSVFCSLLENTKAQYASQVSSPAGNSLSRANTPGMELSDSDSSTDNASPTMSTAVSATASTATTSLLHQALKRKLPEPNQPDLFKRQYFLHGPIYPQTQAQILQTLTTTATAQAGTTVVPAGARPSLTSAVPPLPATVITPDCLFILDFKAARALGVPDFRERLANKHPEILRYCPDNQDRDWLLQQKQVTPLNKNGRYFLLALDDVKRLVERHAGEYAASPYLKLSDLHGFKLTEFIYAKVQKLLKEVSERKPTLADGLEPPKALAVASSTVTSTSAMIVPQRPRVSSLSSSHATLTALLSTPQAQLLTSAGDHAVTPQDRDAR